MRLGIRNVVVGLALVGAGLGGVPAAHGAIRGPVVGFGDSVAIGYGLSRSAEWPSSFGGTSYLGSRFGRGAGCRATRRAYPCVVAAALRAQGRSRDYAIQGATTNDVITTELPTLGTPAVPQMSAAARASVKAVTLTIGGNDFAFDQCIRAELQATPDPCLAGTIDNLSLSAAWQAKISQIETNLPAVIKALGRTFPHATVYVTTYYGFVPGAVAPNRSACDMYKLPALEALWNNIQGLSTPEKVAASAAYLAELPAWTAAFQNRMARVSSFLQGQLNSAIRKSVRVAIAYPLDASQAAPTPVAVVSLDRAFNHHSVCSRRPWVYNFRIQFTVNGSAFSSGARCPFPMPNVGTPAASVEFGNGFSFSASSGPVHVSFGASFATNCLPHPTPAGQQRIALAVVNAANGAIYCPPPPGQTGEGISGIKAQGILCGYARKFVRTSRLCNIPTPTGKARCIDRGWRCRVGRGVSLRDGIGGIPALCTQGRRFVSWHAGY